MFGIFCLAAFNITFGWIFIAKLIRLLSNHKDNEHIQFGMKSLIVKICILTLTGSVSTILCWSLWISDMLNFGAVFLYIDLFVNSMVIGLMFKTNEKHYKRLCKCWIILCFLNCDKSKEKLNEKQVDKYLNWDVDSPLDLDTFFDTVTDSTNNNGSTAEKVHMKPPVEHLKLPSASMLDMIVDVDNIEDHPELDQVEMVSVVEADIMFSTGLHGQHQRRESKRIE